MSGAPIDYGDGLRDDPPAAPAPPASALEDLPLVAIGMGGRIELREGELRIIKDGLFGILLDMLWIANGLMEKRIPLAHVTSIEIVRPLVLPNFIRFSYAGSPPQTGRYLLDAFAENALIMNPLDHRRFYQVRDRLYHPTATAAVGASP
ncbi:MAG: hypothetical protein HYR63_01750 [Proteobacteria bacterium]|nr:hypothetical protein [Pseudomonadota bacterium]